MRSALVSGGAGQRGGEDALLFASTPRVALASSIVSFEMKFILAGTKEPFGAGRGVGGQGWERERQPAAFCEEAEASRSFNRTTRAYGISSRVSRTSFSLPPSSSPHLATPTRRTARSSRRASFLFLPNFDPSSSTQPVDVRALQLRLTPTRQTS